MSTTTILVTGGNRGIGRGVVEAYLSKPGYTVIAAVRDTEAPTTKSLKEIKPASESFLIIVKIDSTSETDPEEAVKALQAKGITSLDIVVANAGIGNIFHEVHNINIDDFRKLFDTNTIGPLVLYKALYPLLKATADKKGDGKPIFVGVSTEAASIGELEANTPYKLGAYGAGKAALNYLVRRAQFENTWLTAFVYNPGFAQTDMGNSGAKMFGFEQAFVPVSTSVGELVKRIDTATRANASGKFFQFDGTEMAF